ncbi:thioredoxin-like protein [Tribonema minus]|uniref:Thioredoxin-like protein n=1 Tax=Tribonema minus TaxID=303371 RepID=A0A836CIL9_9STRA|nr:thioredoxin-like protein [Tribonema minus]
MDAQIKAKVASTPVVIYSKSYCPYCAKAKRALQAIKAHFEAIELDQVSNGAEIQQALKGVTGSSTVPQVFVGGKYIGGGDDTARKQQNGELVQLVTAAGGL